MKNIDDMPHFRRLLKVRAGMTVLLVGSLAAMLIVNLLLLSTLSTVGQQPWIDGNSVSLSLAVIIITIIIAALVAVFYVGWANRVLDKLAERAIAEISERESSE